MKIECAGGGLVGYPAFKQIQPEGVGAGKGVAIGVPVGVFFAIQV